MSILLIAVKTSLKPSLVATTFYLVFIMFRRTLCPRAQPNCTRQVELWYTCDQPPPRLSRSRMSGPSVSATLIEATARLVLIFIVLLPLILVPVCGSRHHHWASSYNTETQHALRHHRGKFFSLIHLLSTFVFIGSIESIRLSSYVSFPRGSV